MDQGRDIEAGHLLENAKNSLGHGDGILAAQFVLAHQKRLWRGYGRSNTNPSGMAAARTTIGDGAAFKRATFLPTSGHETLIDLYIIITIFANLTSLEWIIIL